MGDYNINMLTYSKQYVNELLNILYVSSFLPLIDKPTRITETSATRIDNIFTNNLSSNISSGIYFYTDVTDHLPVYQITANQNINHNTNNDNIHRYVINKQNINCFMQDLDNTVWEDVNSCSNADIAYQHFLKQYEKNFLVKNNSKKKKQFVKNYR